MDDYYQIVPWFNSQEWHEVYTKIFSDSGTDRQAAYRILQLWKARNPFLPSGIESSLTLLEVILHDLKYRDSSFDNRLLRMAYSTAVMRFVNHMLDNETAKGTSLYLAAKNLGIQDWIIDLRHDIAHNSNLPSIELLKESAECGLSWLQKNYWEVHKEHINDNVSGNISMIENNSISVLVNLCCSLSICAHPKCKIKNLSDVMDSEMKDSIIHDFNYLFDKIDLSNHKTVSLMVLINTMNYQGKKIIKKEDGYSLFCKILCEDDSLFFSNELLNYLGPKDLNKKELNSHYVKCAEVVLNFLHINNMLLIFIENLIKITQTNINPHKCKLAALWLSEILKSLKKTKVFMEHLRKSSSDLMDFTNKKDLKQLFNHLFPNGKNCIYLDISIQIPKELRDIHYIQPIISTYNPYLTYFIKNIFDLLEPQLPKSNVEKICELSNIIASPEGCLISTSKIYTLNDLNVSSCIENESECMEVCEESIEAIEKNDKCNLNESFCWQLASDEVDWSSCPVGILPWELKCNQLSTE